MCIRNLASLVYEHRPLKWRQADKLTGLMLGRDMQKVANTMQAEKKHWLGVVGNIDRAKSPENWLWWCFPQSATAGDLVIFYCPRSLDETLQGIFSLYRLLDNPENQRLENSQCRGFGAAPLYGGTLRYVNLEYVSTFEARLTIGDMKKHPVLRGAPFVRRSFQGTTFSLEERYYNAILSAIERKRV